MMKSARRQAAVRRVEAVHRRENLVHSRQGLLDEDGRSSAVPCLSAVPQASRINGDVSD
jgi:hypothetical protein